MKPSSSQKGETLNPWISIWLRPRSTFRHVLSYWQEEPVGWFATASGVTGGLSYGLERALDGRFSLIVFAIAVLAGGLLGYPMLLLLSWIYDWLGRWMGGTGSAHRVRIALGWSFLPRIGLDLIRMALLALCLMHSPAQPSPFVGVPDRGFLYQLYLLSGWPIAAADFCFVVLGLAEAHKFSLARALAVAIMPLLVLTVVLLILYLASS